MDSMSAATTSTPSIKLPLPSPGLLTLRPAFMEVGERHGIMVSTRFRWGRCVWVVVRTQGTEVSSIRVGSKTGIPGTDVTRGQLPEMLAAIKSLQPETPVPVYSDIDSLTSQLEVAGVAMSALYPPATATAAVENAVQEHIESLLGRLVLATDASKGTGHWRGHGWVLDFGLDSPPIMGLKATEKGDITLSELRSIRLGLLEARSRFAGTMDGRCEVTVISDSQNAIYMLDDTRNLPSTLSLAHREQVTIIRALTKNARITYKWVRGHSDNALNNTADRLAVLARRAKEAELTNAQRDVLLAGIKETVLRQGTQQALGLAA